MGCGKKEGHGYGALLPGEGESVRQAPMADHSPCARIETGVRIGRVVESCRQGEFCEPLAELSLAHRWSSQSLWPILDPDLFAVGVDLLEDSLKTLSPAIVVRCSMAYTSRTTLTPTFDSQRTVRVSGVEQGTNALRLLGLRHLPDDIDITSISTLADPKEKQNGSRKDEAQVPLCKEAETADPGKFINVEARFAYRRLPPPVTKGANAHFLVHMGFGVVSPLTRGWLGDGMR